MKTFAVGDKINVRYPYENVGFVKQAGGGVASGAEISQHQSKANEHRSYGR
jgi:hypothetical protein